MPRITALNVYPVKSCGGISLNEAMLKHTGFAYDREWMIVKPDGGFVSQREDPRLALITPRIGDGTLTLLAPTCEPLRLPLSEDFVESKPRIEVTCLKDRCTAIDTGEEAAQWLQSLLGKPYRLVRFDATRQRLSNTKWTGETQAPVFFADGYAYLVLSQASLDDLNGRLEQPLPMNRFRPNIVVDGLPAYGEDGIKEFCSEGIRLRPVKPCTRCIITTTNQANGERDGAEPLDTLRTYRLSSEPRGVVFGQNAILIEGEGQALRVGQELGAK